MAAWVGQSEQLFDPLMAALGRYVLAGKKAHADDTPLAVFDPGPVAPRPAGCGSKCATTGPPEALSRLRGASIRRHILRNTAASSKRRPTVGEARSTQAGVSSKHLVRLIRVDPSGICMRAWESTVKREFACSAHSRAQ